MVERMISPRRIGGIKIRKGSRISFSRIEIRDLFKAWIAISIAFGILLGGLTNIQTFLVAFLISSLTVGIGFLLHELAHKLTAQHYGCWAEFRANNLMLLMSIFFAILFRFVFAAPGAVMIQGAINRKQNGIISLAGPLTNTVLAIIFLLLSSIIHLNINGLNVMGVGFTINAFLAIFNMLPFGFFDGAKVLRWNKIAFGIGIGIPILLMIIRSFI